MHQRVTKENFFPILADYADSKYDRILPRLYRKCPYNLDLDNGEFVYKQVLTWVMLEWINPDTGRTVLEEFVEREVDDEILASRALRFKEVVRDTFLVLDGVGKDWRIIARAESSGREFPVYITGPPQMYRAGRRFTGIIHPAFEEGFWCTNGIITYHLTYEEIFERTGVITPGVADKIQARMEREWQDKAETVPIKHTSRLAPLLKKYPSYWVDVMCEALKLGTAGLKKRDKVEMIASVLTGRRIVDIVSVLSEEEKAVLRFVYQKGGTSHYPDLQRRFGSDDTELWWDRKEPASPIGKLRRRGLLVVGAERKGVRDYKVAAIARDVLEVMADLGCLGPVAAPANRAARRAGIRYVQHTPSAEEGLRDA